LELFYPTNSLPTKFLLFPEPTSDKPGSQNPVLRTRFFGREKNFYKLEKQEYNLSMGYASIIEKRRKERLEKLRKVSSFLTQISK